MLEGEAMNEVPFQSSSIACRKRSEKIADSAYASGENVHFLADIGIEPVIRPGKTQPQGAGELCVEGTCERVPRAWIRRWKSKTGYDRRFEEEHAFAALILRFGDKVRARCLKIARS